MKIIDLLNKIANGEEVPTTIKYQDNYYNLIRKYNEDWEEYEFGYKNLNGGYLNIWRDNVLNDEIEILEEKKIPEKLNWKPKESMAGQLTQKEQIEVIARRTEKLKKEFNNLLDYLKSKGE